MIILYVIGNLDNMEMEKSTNKQKRYYEKSTNKRKRFYEKEDTNLQWNFTNNNNSNNSCNVDDDLFQQAMVYYDRKEYHKMKEILQQLEKKDYIHSINKI